MKRFCFFFIAVAAMLSAVAQSDLVAILQSGDEITPYFGVTAFDLAYKAAKDGDVITLSSGNFNTTTISKSITVKGAGMVNDPESATLATTINDKLGIGKNLNVTLEGLRIKGTVPGSTTGTTNTNLTLRNCYIDGIVWTSTTYSSYYCTYTLINCIVNGSGIKLCHSPNHLVCVNSFINVSPRGNYGLSNCYGSFDNCMIVTDDPMNNFTLTNCFIQPTATLKLGQNCAYNNCVAVGEPNEGLWTNAIGSGGSSVNGYGMFENYQGTFQHAEDLILKNASSYDQVGMYSGKWPFSTRATGGLQITRFDVAPKSTTDGKLSVEIEVAIPQ